MIQTLPGEEATAPPSPSTSATEPNTPVDAMDGGLEDPQIDLSDDAHTTVVA